MRETNAQHGSNQDTRTALPAAGIYGLLALALLVLIMAVTAVLARQPRILTSGEYRLQPGWQPLTDRQDQFTLNTPPNWTWMEAADAADLVRANTHLARPFQLFQALDESLTISMVGTTQAAAAERPLPLFVAVAHSRRLQPLPIDRLIAEVTERDPEMQQVEKLVRPGAVTQAEMFLRTSAPVMPLQCRLRFQTNQSAGFIIAGCANAATFGQYAGDIDTIMDSFQLLQTAVPSSP